MTESHRLPRWLRAAIARRLARPRPETSSPRRRAVCIYKVDRIGDFVLATGAIGALVEAFGAENCRLVVSERAGAMARREFPAVATWTIPSSASGIWREMRPLRKRHAADWATEHFDRLVCLRHARSLYRDVTLSWIHADRWHGLGNRPSADSATLQNRPTPVTGFPAAAELPWSRELAAHRAVVSEVAGKEISWNELRPRLRSAPVAIGTDVVICPFGSEPMRDYGIPGWVEAARRAAILSQPLHVVGSGDRTADVERLAAAFRAAGASVRLTVDAPADDFVAAIATARLVLTVDSAAAHIRTALDRPAVIIVGGGHFGWFAPWGDGVRQRWVAHRLDCYGCNWDCRRPTVECIDHIGPEAVAAAIKEVLAHA